MPLVHAAGPRPRRSAHPRYLSRIGSFKIGRDVPARASRRRSGHGAGWRGEERVARGFASRFAARVLDRYSGAARTPALGAFPHARRRRARHHLDPRWPRGDARGLGRGRAEGEPGARFQRPRCGHRRKRLSARRRRRRFVLRLAHRPARPQEAVLHHHRGLPHGDRAHRLVMERLELLALPLPHRRRHRRRVYGDQLDHPGAGAGPLPRLHRSRDQRQLLDRRRARRGRRDRASRSAHHQSRDRVARLLPHRRDARPRRLPHAHVDSRKPALARAAWPGGAGAGRRRRHRGEVPRRRTCARAGRGQRRDPAQGPQPHAARGKSSSRSFAATASAAWSASR